MKKEKSSAPKKLRICTFIGWFITMILLLQIQYFIQALITDNDRYEIRCQQPIGVTNGQQIYSLFKDGIEKYDVDINTYMLLDDNGNTDLKYCVLMEESSRLAYCLILCGMMIVVIDLVKNAAAGSPFTHKNANRIRLIGGLQFALAIVPGLVIFLMKFFRFQYSSLRIEVTSFFMFAVGFAIMTLAQVFDYGVKLQEDVDSIA